MNTIAHYYDGMTSRAHEAQVSLGEDESLKIHLADRKLIWPLYHPELNWQRTHKGVRIQYGEHPRMVLVINEPSVANDVVKALKSSGKRNTHDSLLQHVKKAPLIVALALSIVVVICYFYVLPPMAENLAEVMPTSADEQLGDMVWSNLGTELNVDQKLSATLQDFADQLELSEEYDLKFYVVDEPVVNAFALPGGKIVVYTGIIDRMHTPGELVALLAHESVHVDHRHSTRQLMRDIAGYAFLSVMVGDVNSVLAIAAEHADNLRSMSYSRELESNADSEGMQVMYRNNVDPAGMVELMSILLEESEDIPEAMEFLSSHPLTSDRIDNAINTSEEFGKPLMSRTDLQPLFDELQNGGKRPFLD